MDNYKVDRMGNVTSGDKVVKFTWKGKEVERRFKGKKLKPILSSSGYLFINAYSEKGRAPAFIHRLVAEKYVENPSNLPCVNHIDGDKLNNKADNLEWVTHKENSNHAVKLGLINEPEGNLNSSFISPIIAEKIGEGYVIFGRKQMERLGFDNSNVYRCCSGRQASHRGFRFSRIMMQEAKC